MEEMIQVVLRTGCGAEKWIRIPMQPRPLNITVPISTPTWGSLKEKPMDIHNQPNDIRTFEFWREEKWSRDGKNFPVRIYVEMR